MKLVYRMIDWVLCRVFGIHPWIYQPFVSGREIRRCPVCHCAEVVRR